MRFRFGDVVQVWPRAKVTEPPAPGSPFWFIHVTGIPDFVPFEKIKNVLMSPSVSTITSEPEIIRRRRWRLAGSVPQAIIDQLKANREITVTYTQAKNHIARKVATNVDNPDFDTEQLLQDSDLA